MHPRTYYDKSHTYRRFQKQKLPVAAGSCAIAKAFSDMRSVVFLQHCFVYISLYTSTKCGSYKK